jgi:hypothetical protein
MRRAYSIVIRRFINRGIKTTSVSSEFEIRQDEIEAKEP